MSKHIFDPRIGQMGGNLIQAVDTMLSQALTAADKIDPGEGASKQLLAIMAIAAPLQFLAGSLAKAPEGKDRIAGINKETMLIAALIAGRCCVANGAIGQIDFSSRNVLAAIEAAAKITGTDMTKYCEPEMLKVYREGVADSDKTDLGYWSYLENVGPSFDGFEGLAAYSSSRH